MQWWTAASVVFITCFSATVNAQAGCDACLCTDADGDVWDLTDLGGPQTVVGPPQSSLYGDWNYHWDICATVTPPSPPLCTAVTTTVAYRLEDYPGTGALCQQLGPASPSLLTVTKIGGDAENGVQLVFSHNTYTMTLNVACDESLRNQDPVFTPPTSGAAAIEIGWASFYACPGHQTGGDGAWGWTFLILTSVAGVLYAGGGWYYNHRQKSLNGKEALPHLDFWTITLPEHVKAGIYFTRMELSTRFPNQLSFLRPTGDGHGYSEVDSDKNGGDSDTSDDDEQPLAAPPPAKPSKPQTKKARAKKSVQPKASAEGEPIE